ncbi:hypothetical protein NBO_48g0014 [Nosema bombycis CQ1]|uniref:Uncharacterized protein n=1 Tax=Nosema bombycis (strain CQ1 / CVCC 102059) TaxID=578461 RepID=R0M7K5_NOSB1|nr:hypothetical protein NBO_48g0014 [Nosema bombycis CQ1]|eukprot:EOB13964.1 hypothetical protein NBO_48g0014 [Nosema bombycis CQ1]
MFINIITCSKSSSGLKLEFGKSIMKFNQHIRKQTKLVFKELKTINPDEPVVYLLGESNLGLMKSLLDYEFYSITSDLKENVFKPMIKLYEDITMFLKRNSGNYLKINSVIEKFNFFFSTMRDASVMKYKLINSEDLELAYFDSKNMRLDEEKIYLTKQNLLSFTLGKIIFAIEDIISEVQVVEGSSDLTKVLVNLTKIVIDLQKKHEKVFVLNKNIQEDSLKHCITKENKIKQCLNFLKCDYNQLKVIIKISELTRDFCMNFSNIQHYNETCNYFTSLVPILDIQKTLHKNCIDNPTVKNLTNYMNFKNVENYKVKDLQATWKLLKNACKMFKSDIFEKSIEDKTYESFKTRYEELETLSLKLVKKLDSFMIESFYLSDLALKSNIINYLLINNQDVLSYKTREKKPTGN